MLRKRECKEETKRRARRSEGQKERKKDGAALICCAGPTLPSCLTADRQTCVAWRGVVQRSIAQLSVALAAVMDASSIFRLAWASWAARWW